MDISREFLNLKLEIASLKERVSNLESSVKTIKSVPEVMDYDEHCFEQLVSGKIPKKSQHGRRK